MKDNSNFEKCWHVCVGDGRTKIGAFGTGNLSVQEIVQRIGQVPKSTTGLPDMDLHAMTSVFLTKPPWGPSGYLDVGTLVVLNMLEKLSTVWHDVRTACIRLHPSTNSCDAWCTKQKEARSLPQDGRLARWYLGSSGNLIESRRARSILGNNWSKNVDLYSKISIELHRQNRTSSAQIVGVWSSCTLGPVFTEKSSNWICTLAYHASRSFITTNHILTRQNSAKILRHRTGDRSQ